MPKKTNRSKVVARSVGKKSSKRLLSDRFWKRPQMLLVVLLVAVAGGYWLYQSFAAAPERVPVAKFVPDRVLVSFRPGAGTTVQNRLLNRYGLSVIKDIPQIQTKVLRVNPKALDAVIAALSHNPAVKFAEKDWAVSATATTPNDYWWPSEWSQVRTQSNQAWDTSTGVSSVVIASLDSGVDFTQPDLQGKLLNNGYDFVNNDANPTDDNGHGTYTAGVAAAASNNGIGITSYCWNCMVMPVKVLDASGGGTTSTVAQGITYAADHGAKIISMSLGGSASSSTQDSAVSYARSKGLSLYAAAGNSSSSTPTYPAATAGVVSVAGTDSTDALYSWSNFGTWVKVAAPGCNYATGGGTWYGTFCGTSSATPAAAGIAGLVWSANPSATATQVEQAILNNSDTCCSGRIGGGRVNAYKAVYAVKGLTTPTDTTPPTVAINSPVAGITVSGQRTVQANAQDNTRVAKVDLYIDGSFYASSSESSTGYYTYYWDTTTYTNGNHTLTVKAYDATGNVGTSMSVTVNVSNSADATAPSASLTTPTNGATLAGTATVLASASDNVGVTETDILIDGVLRATGAASASFTWDTTLETNGTHTIMAKAYDAAGNIGTSTTVTVTISNHAPTADTQPPSVAITAPAAGSSVANQTSVSGTASDNVAVSKMELLIDGKLKTTSTTGIISYSWNINKGVKAGIHTITINAYDSANNKATASETVVK